MASASVSQVHKARLPDGRLVAIKVRRPEGDRAVHVRSGGDARGGALLDVIPSVATLAPAAAVDEFGRAIFAQLDFTIEAANNRRFRENFAGHTDVVFPELVDELCTERVLTMSFIEGTKILSTPATRVGREAGRPAGAARRC